MKFWKEFMTIIEKIKRDIDSIHVLLFKKEADTSEFANENPIITVNNNPMTLLKTDYARKKLIIQNIGTEPCFIKLDSIISKNDFHFVLAPDTSIAYGNGGSVALDGWHGEVWAVAEKKTQISVLEY